MDHDPVPLFTFYHTEPTFSRSHIRRTDLATNRPVSASDKNIWMWSLGNEVRLAQLQKFIPGKSTLQGYVAILLRR